MTIAVAGAGAFGSALAVALALDGTTVTLWGRDRKAMEQAQASRTMPRLPGVELPPSVTVTAEPPTAKTMLLAVPTQQLGTVLRDNPDLRAESYVTCSKGIDLTSMEGPTAVVAQERPGAATAVLSGPSFALEVARELPTALTLGSTDEDRLSVLQTSLSRPSLRLYSTTDVVGVELGGALKNVIAIACGAAIGQGLGESARAALMTRGFAEMVRFAEERGARAQTLTGLSGFGDLALTCTSSLSRNYRFGLSLGNGEPWDPTLTVEGVTTADALARIARSSGVDLPICTTVHGLATGAVSVPQALQTLLSRPLKSE